MAPLAKIRGERDRMSAIERRIADFLFENAHLLRDYSSQKLANALGISQSSVVKFSQKLGFKGYPDLKFSIGESLARRESANGDDAEATDGGIGVINAGEADALEQAYRSAFDVARKLGARSLAVAALGTGSNGVPLAIATDVALSTLKEAVHGGAPFSDVRFVALDASVANAFALALPGLLTAGAIS